MNRILIATILTTLLAAGAVAVAAHERGSGEPRQSFLERHDTNGDGEVTADEYDGRMPFERLDANADGVISQADFQARVAERMTTGLTFRTLRGADEDRDGEVSETDFRAYLASLDTDGDGVLTREELSQMRMREHEGEPGDRRFRHRGPRSEGGGDVSGGERPERTIETSALEAKFAELDGNGDGIVTREELPRRRPRGPRGMRHRERHPRPDSGEGSGSPD